MCSNMESFQNLVYTAEDSDIVCVNETWLNEDIHNSEILNSTYAIFRNDRSSRGGGVLLAVKSSTFKSVREIKHNCNIEITVAELTTASDKKYLLLHVAVHQAKIKLGWKDSITFLGSLL